MNKVHESEPSAFHKHIKMLGDAWMLIIVSELLENACRFNELQRRVCGISPVTLTNRLKKMELLGFIERNAKQEDQLSVSYCITEKGRALAAVLEQIRTYSQSYLSEADELACDKQADCSLPC